MTTIKIDGDKLIDDVQKAARYIVGIDLPDLDEEMTERLVGHLAGAVVVQVWNLLSFEDVSVTLRNE